jgi:hypothetical protein
MHRRLLLRTLLALRVQVTGAIDGAQIGRARICRVP